MNPLLSKSSQKFDAIPFDQIKVDHFLPAIEEGIRQAKSNIEKIKSQSTAPSFENTILALETCSETFDDAVNTYYVLYSAEASPELQALAPQVSALTAEFGSDISLDLKLFEKIKSVYEARSSLKLEKEQLQLLEKSYKSFARNGALLSDTDKAVLRKIDEELAQLTPTFSKNNLDATNAFLKILDSEADLKGLPESAIESAKEEAEKRGHKGKFAITLQQPSWLPVVMYAESESLREEIWKAFGSRCYLDSYDTQAAVRRIVELKYQRAQLLGFPSHAEYVLEERMAQSKDQVLGFLQKLLKHSLPKAKDEMRELEQIKERSGAKGAFKPWDIRFYEERLRKEKFQFDGEQLRPYFELSSVYLGAFKLVERLYGLAFKKVQGVPVYHPDVEVYEVSEAGKHIGLLYMDFFPRETKRSGAWMTDLKGQGLYSGKERRPHIGIVMNFTKPTKTKPSLLNFDEVETFFHEFGHALHGLLSKCQYRSLAGTNVYWDFVELPSQFMENWLLEREVLDMLGRHYQTGELIPKELFDKLIASSQFMAGYDSVRQIQFGLLDMTWFTTNPALIQDVRDFELKATEPTRLLPVEPGVCSSVSFSHIFAGGYSAGYYSYKWAEVLDADAFDYFKENGLFSLEIAKKFKENILEKGGSEHPMELYKRFRGREPDPDALLRRTGLIHHSGAIR